jgi:transcriptional regulator with XRE-family HTH domain
VTIAQNIRALRERKRLLQRDCAKRAGVAQSTWCDWEAGKMSPRIDRLGAVAEVLGCTVARLLA